MIDLHCHLLPGIDDGPQTMEDALELARTAVENGVSRAVVTPHIHHGRYENDRSSINAAFDAFVEALRIREIPLRIGFAAEVRIGPEIMPMIEGDMIPFLGTLGGFRILLLEFPHSHIPMGSEKLVMWLLSRKIRPMIAHPERNKDVLRNFDRIAPFVGMGCFLQVTAGSVAGAFGPESRKAAIHLLEKEWVFALATDAHNLEHRPPELKPGRVAAEKVLGHDASWKLVRENPMSLIHHE